MNEEVTSITENAKKGMVNTIDYLIKEFGNIRAGKASPSMLGSVMVDYYGTKTPLSQVANVNSTDAKTITIQPWEKKIIPEIEKGIMLSNLGFNPMNNGENIIINVPSLTEERRKELSKIAKAEAENAKVGIRNIRRDSNNDIKKRDISEDEKKEFEADIQNLTDTYIKKIDDLYTIKNIEIMKV